MTVVVCAMRALHPAILVLSKTVSSYLPARASEFIQVTWVSQTSVYSISVSFHCKNISKTNFLQGCTNAGLTGTMNQRCKYHESCFLWTSVPEMFAAAPCVAWIIEPEMCILGTIVWVNYWGRLLRTLNYCTRKPVNHTWANREKWFAWTMEPSFLETWFCGSNFQWTNFLTPFWTMVQDFLNYQTKSPKSWSTAKMTKMCFHRFIYRAVYTSLTRVTSQYW